LKSLARITFPEPEKACVYCFVGRLPNAGNAGVILKVLSHPWKMLYRGYTEALQISLVANSGLHQHLRRMDCTQRQNHLSSDTDTWTLPWRAISTPDTLVPEKISRATRASVSTVRFGRSM
jgi:hypothetical protein